MSSQRPLLGDTNGQYRILVLGNSGSGKSTTARRLSRLLNIPHIALDALYFEPNWVESSTEVMVQKVRGALEDAGGSWVVDGDFMSKIGGLVLDATTDIVWLDPPLLLYFPRLMLRTFRRLLGWEAQCRPGCDETLSTFFSGENILLYALTVHRRKRRTYQEIMDLLGVGVGTDVHGRRMRRIGGWGTELEEWLGEVEKLSKGD